MSGLKIDGFDTSALGLILEDAAGRRDQPDQQRTLAAVPGRPGAIDLGTAPVIEPRTLTLTGTQRASTAAELLGFLDQLKRRCARPSVQLIFPDQPSRAFTGTIDRITTRAIAPAFTQRGHGIQIQVTCDDPRAYDLVDTVVALSTVAKAVPLGTAAVRPITRITTPNQPVLIYKDSGGAERGRIELSTTGLTWVEIDHDRGTITGSNGSDRVGDLTDGDFLALDPADGSADGTAWPTLTLTGAASGTATYRKAWQ
jgi:hypothetical protein